MPILGYTSVRGCFTQEKYLKGRSLSEIEDILGFHKGRLSKGMKIVALENVPSANQFEFLGYSTIAEHKHDKDALKKFDINKLKQMVINESFATFGPNRLVKVLPAIGHSTAMDNDTQYPSGLGAPQWKLVCEVSAVVIAEIGPNQKYH
jgi:hypothetical protein